MTRLKNKKGRTVILGIGNLLMSDEGVGVHVIRRLELQPLPEEVECFDGGTGSFLLLDLMQRADRLILVDAAVDDSAPGTVRRLEPRFSSDYPRTLTAHDIGLKDLLDAFYLLGKRPDEVILFAVTIDPNQEMGLELSPQIEAAIPLVAEKVLQELNTANM